jgi:TRAP-type C4-dicarboxylate transport system substrate-binding protein
MNIRTIDVRFRALGCAVILGAGITMGVSLAAFDAMAKPTTTIKVATLAPEGSTWMNIMADLDAEVREATGGAVDFKFYPNMVQGDENTVLRKIRTGQLHGGAFTGAGLGEIAPAIRVLELPFLIRDAAEVDAVHAAVDETFTEMLDQKGFVLLGWAEVGPVYLFTNTPVASREDMSGVKMWLWEGDPVAEKLFQTFDIPPIPLSIAHVRTSLQTGMVDGIYSSPYGCIALQWFTRVKYMTDIPVAHATGAFVVSKKAFAKIPPEHQETVKAIARKHLDRLVAATRKENDDALTELRNQGIEIVSPDPTQLAGFQAKAREVWTALAGELYAASLLSRVESAIEAQRSSLGQVATEE